MALKVELVDPKNGHTANINGEGEINVVVHPHPPKNEVDAGIPFRQYFQTAAGSNNMVVTTTTEFSITADQTRDIYVKSASVLLADAGANLAEFGALTALTNGVKLEWITTDFGTSVIHEGIKDNLEFIRLAGGQPAFGTGSSAFLADISGGGADAYLPFIDFTMLFGKPWGIRLRAGTRDRLTWTVQDNLTGITTFNIIGYGSKF